VPLPYGGKYREVMVDLIPEQMFARTCRPPRCPRLGQPESDSAGGRYQIGDKDYQVKLNSSPRILTR